MSISQRRLPYCSFLLRLSVVALLGASASAQAAEPLRIGVPVGLSGANSVIAPAVVQASQLAADEINAAGGILGRQVVLEIADDASSAVGAQKAYDTLVFQKKVDAVIAMETSAARNAALPIINRGKIPYIYSSFYEGRSCNRWMHVNGWVPEQQVAPIVDHFMKERGVKTFFLVGSDYPLAGACSSSPASTSRSRVARWWARNTCPWTAPTGRPSSPRSARPSPAR